MRLSCHTLTIRHVLDGIFVRVFKIALNDCDWSSNKSRGEGLRKLAIAQLGSDTIDQNEFVKRVSLRIAKEIVSDFFRIAGTKLNSNDKFLQHADKFANVKDLDELSDVSRAAADDAYDVCRNLATAPKATTDVYAKDVECAFCVADNLSRRRYAAAVDYVAAAVDYVAAAHSDSDSVLTKAAQIAVDVLIELKSPGCEWLDVVK